MTTSKILIFGELSPLAIRKIVKSILKKMEKTTIIAETKGSELKQTLQRIELQIQSLKQATPEGAIEKPCDVKEAAEFLGCTPQTLREKAKKRLLPHHRLTEDQGKFYFFKSELSEYIKTRRVKTIQEIDNLATEFIKTI